MMKKWLGFALALMLMLGSIPFGAAETQTVYQLGDRIEDFSITLSDGTQASLYGLLEGKKAVLLNFWASWCSPCQREFPLLDQLYGEFKDDISVLALSCEIGDSDEKVLDIKKTLGLKNVLMGLDALKLNKRFNKQGLPTTVLVDRNGVICYVHSSAFTVREKLVQLISLYTTEDYAQPVLLEKLPPLQPDVAQPTAEALEKALGAQQSAIAVDMSASDGLWPFIPSEDGSCVLAANHSALESVAKLRLQVTVQAGEALQYEYALSCPAVYDCLTISLDGAQAKYYGGNIDWTSDYLPFATSGEHTVEFTYKREVSYTSDTSAMLRNMRVISAEETASLDANKPSFPKTLNGGSVALEPLGDNVRWIIVKDIAPTGEAREQRMLIAEGGELTLRVRTGADVDESVAYLFAKQGAVLLANLPYDSEGFLYPTKVPELDEDPLFPLASYQVGASAQDKQCEKQGLLCFASEAAINAYAATNTYLSVLNGFQQYQMTWEYEDGSPKQNTEASADAVTPRADGKAEYRVIVQNEAGEPLQGAMIQICDLTTCQVVVTDDNGLATHIAAPYPYEFHLLKAPEGYAPDDTTYVMREAGDTLTYTLKKQ